MSFLDWFLGRKPAVVVPPPVAPITPIPAPPPDVAPAPIPVDTQPAPASGPVITIENFSRYLHRWRPMSIPFASSSEVKASKLGGVFFKVRVTVLEGKLTIAGTACNGPHSPTITKIRRGTVYLPGESFIVECSMAPSTVTNTSGHAQVNFGVHTAELG